MDYKHNIKFVCGKNTLEMNTQEDMKIINIQGIEASNYSVLTSNSSTDGANFNEEKVNPRTVIITGDVAKNDNENANREKLIRFFDPKQQGMMYITRNSISRRISYRVNNLIFQTNQMASFIQFTLTLDCIEEPYLEDAENSGASLTEITPQFTFPLGIAPTKIMGYKRNKDYLVLYNNGDKDTGVVITISAKGEVVNPKIILNDGEYILINQTMANGDKIVINTNPRQKSVTYNGTNIINKIDRYSTFFSIAKGKNRISYEVTSGDSNVDILVEFYNKYLGV